MESVKKQYTIYNQNNNFFCVDCNELLTDYEYIFIAIKNLNEMPMICDFANNLQNLKIDLEITKEICKKYDVIFDDYNLKKIFNSNKDIQTYISCIKEISKKSISC